MWKFIVQIATQLSWLFNYLLFCSFAKPYYCEFELPETLLGIVDHYESPNITAVSSEEEEECAVCLCKIEEGEELRELRCAHLFHKTCLDRWTALNHVTCPLCRSFLAPPVQQLKLHMSERHQRSSPYVPHYAPVLTPSFSFKGLLENVRNAFGTWGKSVGEASKKAGDIAGNSWHHLKTSPRFADAAMGRISRATKVLTKGGCERIFRSTFEMVPEEHLQHSFACYLSTSSGPVMGVLYLSTAKIAYCSDNLVSHKFENQTESGYYKVVIPLHQLKAVNPSLSRSHSEST